MNSRCVRRTIFWLAMALLCPGVAWGESPLLRSNSEFVGDLADGSELASFADPQRAWFAGVEATFLRPRIYDRGDRVSLEQDTWTADNLRFDFSAAPRAWVGLETSGGWGLQTRYWNFEAEDHLFQQHQGGADVLEGSSLLHAFALDVEGLKRGRVRQVLWTATAGARYAGVEHHDHLQAALLNGTLSSASEARQFNGAGVTGSLGAERLLTSTGWTLIGNVRGSWLWGANSASATAAIANSTTVLHDAQFARLGGSLSIVETQLGIGWGHELDYFRGALYARCCFEFQSWMTPSNMLAGVGAAGGGNAARAASSSSDTDFRGLSVAVGFSR